MNDKELLVFAAKAADICVEFYETHGREICKKANDYGPNNLWNPLMDDGDALRLAVKLGLTVYQWDHEICVCNEKGTVNEIVARNEDAYAATRRAIVLAAAEIGKAMP